MKATQTPEFDTRDRTRIYRHVERHGAVTRVDLCEERLLGLQPGRIAQLVRILKRDGYLREDDGMLRVGLDAGDREEFAREGFSFAIRPARQEDRDGILTVIRRVVSDETYVEASSMAEQLDHEDALIRHNGIESRMFFVATVDGRVIGWCHLSAPDEAKLRHTATLTVGVLEDYRGEGIGSHLLVRGQQWAVVNGFETVSQSIPAANDAAVAFLHDHGWTIEARRPDHYRVDAGYLDEVMMARHLPA